jgi:hypothetical protein
VGCEEGEVPRQIHRTRLLAATRLSSQLPTLLFKRTQTHGRWKANTERKGIKKKERERIKKRRFQVKIKFGWALEDRQLCCKVQE